MIYDDDREVNVPLLRKAVEWVEEQDQLARSNRIWKQSVWMARRNKKTLACETAMCLAGWVVTQAGYHFSIKDGTWGETYNSETDDYDREFKTAWATRSGMKEPKFVSHIADELLGLPIDNHNLYDARNTAADIRRIAEDLAGERL